MSRRFTRELAFKTLFQIDLGNGSLEDCLERSLAQNNLKARDQTYLQNVVRGVRKQLSALDAQIAAISQGWPVHRLGAVERNILRLAIYEIVFMDDIPVKVSINEAVELTKQFANLQSARFVNGLLGTVVRDGGFR